MPTEELKSASKPKLRLLLPFVGNVSHWALLLFGRAVLDTSDLYERRSFRTRTVILGRDSLVEMNVPVHTVHHLPYKQIKLNYDSPWPQQHIYALQTAYNSTPYFEFFATDFERLYALQYEYLFDFNVAIMNLIARLIGVELSYSQPSDLSDDDAVLDLRGAILPRHVERLNALCQPIPYSQIFSKPYVNRPFSPNLSMFDLLFNMGPESRIVLRQMIG